MIHVFHTADRLGKFGVKLTFEDRLVEWNPKTFFGKVRDVVPRKV